MTPYTLIRGDALDEMQRMDSESVDMIFADPPFNVGKDYGGGKKGDRIPDSEYYSWCAKWIREGFRLLKPTGTFYLMNMAKHIFEMGYWMSKHGVFVNKIEWRNVNATRARRCFWWSTQSIAVFGKTDRYKFNPRAQLRKIDPYLMRRGGYSDGSGPQGYLLDYWDDIPFVYAGSRPHPEAILRPGKNSKVHPAQLPIGLPARCILFSTDPGDVVLDPFCGSGSALVAAIRHDRIAIGIDLDKGDEYINLAASRLEMELRQTKMRL